MTRGKSNRRIVKGLVIVGALTAISAGGVSVAIAQTAPVAVVAQLQAATTPAQVNDLIAAASATMTPDQIAQLVSAAVAAHNDFAASIVSAAAAAHPEAANQIASAAIAALPVNLRDANRAALVSAAAIAANVNSTQVAAAVSQSIPNLSTAPSIVNPFNLVQFASFRDSFALSFLPVFSFIGNNLTSISNSLSRIFAVGPYSDAGTTPVEPPATDPSKGNSGSPT